MEFKSQVHTFCMIAKDWGVLVCEKILCETTAKIQNTILELLKQYSKR